jgi:hypothetical protein
MAVSILRETTSLLLQAIKNLPTCKQVPVILHSSWVTEKLRAQGFAAGCLCLFGEAPFARPVNDGIATICIKVSVCRMIHVNQYLLIMSISTLAGLYPVISIGC